MDCNNRKRTFGDRARDAVLAIVALGLVAQLLPSVFAAWDQTKPANNSALVSSEIRANWASLQAALGNPDTVPLSPAVAVQFIGAPAYKPGGASTYAAKVVGTVSVNLTDVGNFGAGTDDLMTYALPAAMLSVDNKSLIRFTAWGTLGATANAKSVLVTFGATAITVIDATSVNAGHWRIQGEIVRVTSTTQKTSGAGSSMSNTATGNIGWAKTGTAAETLANSITFKIQAIGTTDNDIVQKGLIVEYLEMP